MKKHEKRVVEEKSELDKKILALSNFIQGDVYDGLKSLGKSLLKRQINEMRNYSATLNRRIGLFE